jgi:hypothetical protein
MNHAIAYYKRNQKYEQRNGVRGVRLRVYIVCTCGWTHETSGNKRSERVAYRHVYGIHIYQDPNRRPIPLEQ